MPVSMKAEQIRSVHAPLLEIYLVGPNPPKIDLSNRTLSFTLIDNDENYDTFEWQIDNSDGALTRPENLALGLFAELRYGYPTEKRPWMRYVINRIRGGVGVGNRHHPVIDEDRTITYYGRNRNAPDLKGRAVRKLQRSAKIKIRGQTRFKGRPTADLALPDMWDRRRKTNDYDENPRVIKANRLSDVAREIAKRNGFTPSHQYIEESPDKIKEGFYVMPESVSDAECVASLAQRLGWVFRVDINGFHFHSRHWSGAKPTVHHFKYGEDADVLGLQIDGDLTLPQPNKIKVTGYDPMLRSTVFADAEEGNVNHMTIRSVAFVDMGGRPKSKNYTYQKLLLYDNETVPVANPAEMAKADAIRAFTTRALKSYKIVLRVVGNPTVQAGHYVKISGTSSPLADGLWYAFQVKHIFDGQTYVTEITLGLPPKTQKQKKVTQKVLRYTVLADPEKTNPNKMVIRAVTAYVKD